MISDRYEALKIIHIESLKEEKTKEFNEAVEFLRNEGFPVDKELELLKEEDEEFKKALKVSNDLFNILKDFTLLKVGKFDEELKSIKEILKECDKLYVARTSLYKDLIELPKYKNLEEDEKIALAMKIGALDMRDLTSNKELR